RKRRSGEAAVLLSDGLRLLAVCRASSRTEAACRSKGSVAARSWAGLQPGFISFTSHLAVPVAEWQKKGGTVRAPSPYTLTVAKMGTSPRRRQETDDNGQHRPRRIELRLRDARRAGERQRPRPDARMCSGEVSWPPSLQCGRRFIPP